MKSCFLEFVEALWISFVVLCTVEFPMSISMKLGVDSFEFIRS
jgi:hypothetical protein